MAIAPRLVSLDPRLSARIVQRTPLRYDAGADAALDRPAHVRGGSALALVAGRLLVVQDDANFLAVLDPATGAVEALTLPAGHAGRRQFDDARGNKKFRLDLEACTVAPGPGGAVVLAFGSGSSKRREHVVVIEDPGAAAPRVSVRPAAALYALLRATPRFAGSELNVEGAVYREGQIWLFGRGNGERRDGLDPVNATCTLDWLALAAHLEAPERAAPPEPANVVQYALGALGGIPLGFTDATGWGPGLLFTAAAERSPDTRRDGPVSGSVLGALRPGGGAVCTPILDPEGAPFGGKVEGIAAAGTPEGHVHVVVDQDDAARPSELCLVQLGGPWREDGG